MAIETVYEVWVHLKNEECGNILMQKVAEETLNDPKYADKQPLLVFVVEHGGWWLAYTLIDNEMTCVGSANDRAQWHGNAKEWREDSYHAKRVTVESIRR